MSTYLPNAGVRSFGALIAVCLLWGFLADGTVEDLPFSYVDSALNLYFEYGLHEYVTLVAHGTPTGFARAGENSAFYMGPISGGIRLPIWQRSIKIAGELRYGYAPPLGEAPVATGVHGGTPIEYRPAYASHRADGELQLGYGLPFGWVVPAKPAISASGLV